MVAEKNNSYTLYHTKDHYGIYNNSHTKLNITMVYTYKLIYILAASMTDLDSTHLNYICLIVTIVTLTLTSVVTRSSILILLPWMLHPSLIYCGSSQQFLLTHTNRIHF